MMTFLQKKTKIVLISLYFFFLIYFNLELSCCLCESTSNYCTRTYQPERIGSEFQVNTHTNNNQENPSIAAIGCQNQKFVICWQSEGQDGSYDGIFAQVFNSTDGSKIGNEFQVNNYTSYDQKEPLVASIGRGSSMGNSKKICSENKEKFVISWQSYGQDGSYYGVYAQVFNSTDHSKIGLEFLVNNITNDDQVHPAISPIYGKDYVDDKFVIAWSSELEGVDGTEIFAQVFNSTDSSKIDPEFQVNTYSESFQYSPDISSLWNQKNTEEGEDEENDKFVISWIKDESYEGYGEEVYAQVFNSTDHSKIGNEFQVNTLSTECQNLITITSIEEKYVISWEGQSQDRSDYGIFAQIYNSTDNSKIGNEFQVKSLIDYNQYNLDTQRIMGNNREKFVIAWQSDHLDEDRFDIYLKIYDSNTGEALFNDDFLINDDTPNIQNNHEPKITSIGGGDGEDEDRFVITWESGNEETVDENDGDGSYRGIYAQIFSSKLVCNCYKGFFTNSTIANECQECHEGTYQDQEGQTDCKKCTVGQYQNMEGSSFCYDCPKGFFQDLEGQPICQKCPVGYYQNQIRQSDCINCPIGTYQDMEGQSYCNDCPLNTYQDQESKSVCKECPIGTYTQNLRSTSIDDCVPCEKGTYWNGQLLGKEKGSVGGKEKKKRDKILRRKVGEKERVKEKESERIGRRTKRKTKIKIQTEIEEGENQCLLCPSGTYQNLTGQTHCQSCPVGTYNPYEGSTSEQNCLECMMGEYNALESQSSCNLCSIGTYQNSKGQSNCMDCLQGSYTDQEGSTTCELCTSGTYQNENGQFQCKNCDFNTYQQYIGATECLYCPLFSETLATQTQSIKECFCSIGYYGEPGTNCQKCPDNGICNTFNQQYPLPSEGYWSSKTDLNTLIKCEIYESCPGYETEKCDSELGYTGYLCSECLSGFYKFEDQCEICPINNNSRLILFFILFVILIILLLIIAKKGKNYFGSFSIFINFLQVIAILPKLDYNWPIKLTDYFQFFSIINFNIDFLALECSINLIYEEKWFIIMLLPFILIFILLLIYIFLFIHSHLVKFIGPILINKFPNLCAKPNKSQNQNKLLFILSLIRSFLMKIFLNSWSKENLKVFLNTCINVFVASLLVLYLILALKIFEFFDCNYSSNLKQYIFQPDKNHFCFDQWWYQLLPFVIVFMILYIIGIPIFFATMLWYHSKKVNEKVFNQRLSLLYSRYKIEYFYWEIIIIFRKFFIVIFEIYLTNYPLVQIILLICCLLFSIIIQNIYKPYNTPNRNFYEFSLLTITVLIFFISMFFLTKEKQNNEQLYLNLANLIIAIFSTVLCIFLIISFLEMKNRIKYNIKKSKIKKTLKSLNDSSNNNHSANQKEPIYLIIKSKKNHNFRLLLNFYSKINNSKNKKFNILSKIIINHYISNQNKNQFILNSIQEKWISNISVIILKWYQEKADFLWKYRFCNLFMKFMNYYLYVDKANRKTCHI
ncbi:hypothetical protein M0812_14022 [Anaeramoeba flamelloides]|uniref:Tyrosine-protein kinase ephrin type A/B receptor-like domain-containing protein n=1 Tax=Anaeramoeba flamelloides TaxID=1746091 RepID=A0AAV7ZPT5_9EUKA|nr:hypothetical protein M0812_14022 [Anaeramoeba flamelloides]